MKEMRRKKIRRKIVKLLVRAKVQIRRSRPHLVVEYTMQMISNS